MSKIERFTIDMQPFMDYGDKWYEIRVRVDGELMSISRVIAPQAPYEAEIESLTRMGAEIVRGLREKDEHQGCCNCCDKKNRNSKC